MFTGVENTAICFRVILLRLGECIEFVMIILLNSVKEFQPTAVFAEVFFCWSRILLNLQNKFN